MSVEEFAQGPAQSGILTDRCSSVQCLLVPNVCLQGNGLSLLAFHGESEASGGVSRRSPVQHDGEGADCLQVNLSISGSLHFAFVRFHQIESRWGYSGTSDKIRF